MPVALISGGLGDIGAAIARELAERFSAGIALADIRPDADAEPLLRDLRDRGRQATYTVLDVADADEVAAWVARTESTFGQTADMVIPNAATVTLRSVRAITPTEWSREIAVNLSGAFYMAQAATARLLAQGQTGRIVFVGSWAADAVHTNLPAYCVAKAGLRMLMRCLALDLAPSGILVNEVAPGYVDAGMSGRIFDSVPGARERARAQVPNRRLIGVADVAREVAHLCDPETRHCVGTTLLMDGGLSLRTPGDAT